MPTNRARIATTNITRVAFIRTDIVSRPGSRHTMSQRATGRNELSCLPGSICSPDPDRRAPLSRLGCFRLDPF